MSWVWAVVILVPFLTLVAVIIVTNRWPWDDGKVHGIAEPRHHCWPCEAADPGMTISFGTQRELRAHLVRHHSRG